MEAVEVQVSKNTHPLAKKRTIVVVSFSILLVLACTASLMIGPVSFTISEVWSGIFHSDDSLARRIIWELRFPRVLIGMIVGMCLAVSGAILQGVMKNPLADPGIIGVSSGAGLAATTIMIIFPAYILFLPLAAFIGALITALIIYAFSWKGGTSPVRIILVGVAINAVIGAFMSALMLLYSDRVQSVLPWLAGGIGGVGWIQFEIMIYYAVGAIEIGRASCRERV